MKWRPSVHSGGTEKADWDGSVGENILNSNPRIVAPVLRRRNLGTFGSSCGTSRTSSTPAACRQSMSPPYEIFTVATFAAKHAARYKCCSCSHCMSTGHTRPHGKFRCLRMWHRAASPRTWADFQTPSPPGSARLPCLDCTRLAAEQEAGRVYS